MDTFEIVRQALHDERALALATVIAPESSAGKKLVVWPDGTMDGSLEVPRLDERVVEDALRLLAAEQPAMQAYRLHENEYQVFIEVYPVPPQVIIVGATHTAIPLSRFARDLGYRVTVTDARGTFARRERFPDAHRVIKGWPQDVLPNLRLDEATYLVLLSHDSKFDQPTLDIALPSAVRYIGAIGSRKTQRERFERLRDSGYSEEQLSRIYGPIGLDLGGRSAEETALAIISEITAVRHGADGGYMRRRLQTAESGT